MIPKIIHYCWFGRKEKPAEVVKCMETWKKYFPDYVIKEWNESNFDVNSSVWTKEAMDCQKYAFVSDYVRLKVLYEYGGIYMDTDVEVLKPLDDLLDLPYFIGAENTIHGINTATIGTEPHSQWIKQCFDHYSGRHFRVKGRMDQRVNPELIKDSLLMNGYNIMNIYSIKEFSSRPTDFYVFPALWFSPIKNGVCLADKTTYTIHRYAASWGDKINWRKRMINNTKDLAKSVLPEIVTNYILKKKKERRDNQFDKL